MVSFAFGYLCYVIIHHITHKKEITNYNVAIINKDGFINNLILDNAGNFIVNFDVISTSPCMDNIEYKFGFATLVIYAIGIKEK